MRRGKTGEPGEKTSRSKDENHCAIPAPPKLETKFTVLESDSYKMQPLIERVLCVLACVASLIGEGRVARKSERRKGCAGERGEGTPAIRTPWIDFRAPILV